LEYYIALATRTGITLARWKVAYNERNLDGWSGDHDVFQAYGTTIRANLEARARDGGMLTSQLTCDVTFDGDFSLEAQMRIETEDDGAFKGRLMGLCFGQKGDQDFHAVMLHPKGFMDIATNRGGDWEVRDHRSMPVRGGEWHTLRIDVTGQELDVYFDGLYVRSLEFGNPAAVRGAFGLIAGEGEATFRNVRLLARDPHDPAARVERQLAMQKVMADAALRQQGCFTGLVPPELAVDWQQGEPVTLAELRGKPVLLGFWTPAQDRIIPCTAYYNHLIEQGSAAGLETILVCDRGTTPGDLTAYLREHPMPKARVAIDQRRADGGAGMGATYEAYWVKPGHFGLPRILLIDGDGKVVFEGDPGLRAGKAWSPADGPTYVDAAFTKLLGQ
jgi:hypothetical protein